MSSNKKYSFNSLNKLTNRYSMQTGGDLNEDPPRKPIKTIREQLQEENNRSYAEKIKEAREKNKLKQEFANRLLESDKTVNIRDKSLIGENTEKITPDDPRFEKYWNADNLSGYEKEVYQELIPEFIYINENPVTNPQGLTYNYFGKDYKAPKIEVERKDPYEFPTTKVVNMEDKGIQPLPSPHKDLNPNLHKEYNPISGKYEPMSPSNARQLERAAYQNKNIPENFNRELKDSISGKDASFINALTYKRQHKEDYPEVDILDKAVSDLNKTIVNTSKEEVPTFKHGGDMKKKKHRFKPLTLHPNAVVPGKKLSYNLGGNLVNPSVYGGKHLDTEKLRDDVINPRGHGAAETATSVSNKALDMFIPGVGTLNEMSQNLASSAGEKLGGVKGQAIAENITNPFKAISNVSSYGFDGLTGKAQDEMIQSTINQHLNWEDDSMSFQQNIPKSFQTGGDLNSANTPLGNSEASGRSLDYNEYEGNSHAEGGIAVGPNAEVEGGEVRVEDYIFSDFLEDPETGKTFAELAKKVDKKYEGRGDNDPPSNRAKKKELEKIMAINEQERIKQEELEAVQEQGEEAAVDNMAMDVEDTLSSEEQAQLAESEAEINPEEEMLSKEMSPEDEMMLPPGEDMIPQFKYGGKKKYIGGGPIDLAGFESTFNPEEFSNQLSNINSLGSGNVEGATSESGLGKLGEFMSDPKNQGLLSSLAPGISDIARSSRVEDVNYARLPELERYQGNDARAQVTREAGRAQSLANESLRGAGASSGAGLATRAGIASSVADSSMRSLSSIADKEQASFVDAANRRALMNNEISNREMDANAQNRAMRETTRSMAEKDMSAAMQGNIRDKSMTEENDSFNEMQLRLIDQFYPNYSIMTPEQRAQAELNVKEIMRNFKSAHFTPNVGR